VVLLASGCTAAGAGTSQSPAPAGLDYSNQTTLSLGLFVNGQKVATMAPNTNGDLGASTLPALPWAVEARTASGRAVASLTVRPGDVVEGSNTSKGDGVRVGLSCGILDIWSGPPLAGPAPGSGQPGDCNP
jgi:hypothetical protein